MHIAHIRDIEKPKGHLLILEQAVHPGWLAKLFGAKTKYYRQTVFTEGGTDWRWYPSFKQWCETSPTMRRELMEIYRLKKEWDDKDNE